MPLTLCASEFGKYRCASEIIPITTGTLCCLMRIAASNRLRAKRGRLRDSFAIVS